MVFTYAGNFNGQKWCHRYKKDCVCSGSDYFVKYRMMNNHFTEYKNMAIVDNNDKIYDNFNYEACKVLCKEETSFYCKSIDYYIYSATNGKCHLSSKNKDDSSVTF